MDHFTVDSAKNSGHVWKIFAAQRIRAAFRVQPFCPSVVTRFHVYVVRKPSGVSKRNAFASLTLNDLIVIHPLSIDAIVSIKLHILIK